jgi:uncharacterized protein YndB with AHSA1/START domain
LIGSLLDAYSEAEMEVEMMSTLRLTKTPSVKVGLLVRTPPERVFEAFRDPAVTTKFWYTKSTGEMTPGATLRWDWEMYGVASDVTVDEVEEHRRIAFRWNDHDSEGPPTRVELRFDSRGPNATHVVVTEDGFRGDGDTLVELVAASTEGFTFVLSALKAYLEHDLVLHIVEDAHPDQRVA